MRRILTIVAVLAVLAGLALIAAPSMVPADRVQSRIAEQIESWTGGRATLRGDLEVSVVPALVVTVDDVVVSGVAGAKDAPPVTISSLQASLKLLPLLMGRVELGHLTVIEPQIHLRRDGTAPGGPASARLAGGTPLDAALPGNGDGGLRELFLVNGTITYEDIRASRTEVIKEATFRLVPDAGTRAVVVSGRFSWRDMPIRIEAELEDPGAALSGAGSHGRLLLTTDPVVASAVSSDGAQPSESPVDLAGLTRTARRLVETLGGPGLSGRLLGPLSIAGEFAINDHAATLSDATFTLGEISAKGSLSLGLAGLRPLLDRLLTVDEGELDAYADALEDATLADWLALPVRPDWLARIDAHFRASATDVRLGSVEFDEATLSVAARRGEVTLELGAQGATAGRLEGNLTIGPTTEPGRPGIAVALSGRVEDGSVADFGRLISAMRGTRLVDTGRPPEGTASTAVELSATGATIGELFHSLEGSITTEIRDGSIDGADIVSTLERLEDGKSVMAEGDAPFIPVGGRTHFKKLGARLNVGAGIARSNRISISGDRFEIALLGKVNLMGGDVKAAGSASLLASDSDGGLSRRVVELPFGMGGTVREPVVAPGVPRIAKRPDPVNTGGEDRPPSSQ